MATNLDPKIYLEQLLQAALSALQVMPSEGAFAVTTPDPRFGDYTTNAPLVLAKTVKRKPPELAAELIQKLKKLDAKKRFAEITAAGGFINFRLSEKELYTNLAQVLKAGESYGRKKSGKEKVLVEYFQPNIAKPLHLGHLRTAILGDALFNILQAAGFSVESDTHIGDWGTQFGLLLAAYKLWGDEAVIASDPINELNKLYVRVNAEAQDDPKFKDRGREEFAKLERGDKENRRLWQRFADWSWQEFDKVYDLLAVRRADHNWGESFYEDKMAAVVDELKKRALLVVSQGAQIVDLAAEDLGVAIIIKSDGATTYLLRDLAAYIYRKKARGYRRQLYVVDVRQQHTLAQTFKVLQLMGEIQDADEAVHVGFGFLSLPEGAMSTRRGNVIGPAELLERAHEKVSAIIREKNPDLKDVDAVAWDIARGAIKYFDLSHNRKSDIVFRWEEVLDFEGNSGPYLQYSHARLKSILRRHGKRVKLPAAAVLTHSTEQQLCRLLVKYSDAVNLAAATYMPNHLADYLYALAGASNAWYHSVRVLDEPEPAVKFSRLALAEAVAQVLKNGLNLLGITAPEQM